MKSERSYPKCIISSKGADWVQAGHPWIYEGEVVRREGDCPNGALADAVSGKGRYLGTGFTASRARSACASSPATPTTALTRPSGAGASSTPGTTARRSWGRIWTPAG